MERDSRRSQEQWRGCHTFDDIICDGNGVNATPRTGGLKMGATYYYYYEVDNGSEVHDTAVPSTTACPYMPGQPVNILWVPVEVPAPRYRSGSVDSIMREDMKTMRPEDRFMTPRAPPPRPHKARPASEPSDGPITSKSEKSGWAAKLFGCRAASSGDPTPRRSSDPDITLRSHQSSANSGQRLQPESSRRATTPIRTHDPTLRKLTSLDSQASPLYIPLDIPEEHEDESNFASSFDRFTFDDNFTRLAPSPSQRIASPALDTSKPLPRLPGPISTNLLLSPSQESTFPRSQSHFSISTTSTTSTSALVSPTESNFGFSDSTSVDESYDESDLDTFTYNPVVAEVERRRFACYSLPEGDYSSEQTIVKGSFPQSHDARDSGYSDGARDVEVTMSALDELLHDLGYLGDNITDN